MKDALLVIAGSVLVGSAAYATLPPPTPEEKAAAAAKAEKDAAAKAVAQKALSEAQDKAVSSYRKAHPAAAGGTAPGENRPGASRASAKSGADHADSRPPDAELTPREAQTEMPKPGQANDHSTTARDPRNSSGSR